MTKKSENKGHKGNGSPARPSVVRRREARAAKRAAVATAMAAVAGK